MCEMFFFLPQQTRRKTFSTIVACFLRCIRDPLRVSRISENYHRVLRINEIASLQVHTGYLTFSLKKTWL